jgi:hypothetical protein
MVERVLTARLMAKESGLNPVGLLSQDINSIPSGVERLAAGLGRVQAYGQHLFVLEGTRQDTVERIRATAYNLMHEFRTRGGRPVHSVCVFRPREPVRGN